MNPRVCLMRAQESQVSTSAKQKLCVLRLFPCSTMLRERDAASWAPGGGWLRASSKSVSPHAPSSAKYFLLRACGHVVARTLLGLVACRARGSCNQGCSIRNLLDLASRLYRCCSQRDSSTSDLLLIRNTANLSPVTCDHPSRPSVFVPTVVCDMPFLIKKSVEVPGAQPAVC